MPLNRARARQLLNDFDFQSLFVQEMGWNSVPDGKAYPVGDTGYKRRLIAEMSGVTILEVFPTAPNGALPDRNTSDKIHRQIEKLSHENVIIFLDNDRDRSKSMLYWVKREEGKRRPRRHHYFRGQPGDLFMSKIDGMAIEMDELREDGSLPISEMTYRLAAALDIERVTKRFYNEFSGMRLDFIDMIEGIPNDADRFWYASVLLNRLMFIYFLQKKGFIQNNSRYLDDKLRESAKRGPNRYYSEFLDALFFEGFAKPAHERSAEAKSLLGSIPYLNGGLFLRHKLEDENSDIRIPDKAFDNVLRLFGHYSWHLDDTPGARDNEINPDVLGYIFEKYINQKAFGAYYTRTEITEYLCERSIHSVILAKVNQSSERQFDDLSELLMRLDADLCHRLLDEILPKLSILDPACGSGAFLVAAMKNLLDVYGAVYGRIEVLNDHYLSGELAKIRREHPSLNYFIRKRIIVDNLYGVDIMDEATEIAKLRLFLALVSSAEKLDDLEPLPNIDFNIMAGNSLIGLLNVDEKRFDDSIQMEDMMQRFKAQDYQRALAEKNRLIALYRDTDSDYSEYLQTLRQDIDEHRDAAQIVLNEILLDDFRALKIQYEQAQLKGKAVKRPLETTDIKALQPFHWGYEFDEIIETRGGFDVIVGNPPYIRIQTLKETMPEAVPVYKTTYVSASKGNYDIYVAFVEQSLRLLNSDGLLAFILPHKFFNMKYGMELRKLIARGQHLKKIVHFGAEQAFPGKATYTCLLFLAQSGQSEFEFAKVQDLDAWIRSETCISGKVSATQASTKQWNFAVGRGSDIFYRFAESCQKLGDLTDIFVGLQTSADDVYIMNLVDETDHQFILRSKSLSADCRFEKNLLHPVVSGTDVSRYAFSKARQYILFPYTVQNEKATLITFHDLEQRFPLTAKYLLKNRDTLESRERGKFKDAKWYRFGRSQNLGIQERVKLCIPRLVENLYMSFDDCGDFYLDNVDVCGITIKPEFSKYHYLYLLGVLNSKFLRWYFPFVSSPYRGSWWSANKQFLSQLPFRVIDFDNSADVLLHSRIVALVEDMLDLHRQLPRLSGLALETACAQIYRVDAEIDELVYELYGLTDDEVRIVEG